MRHTGETRREQITAIETQHHGDKAMFSSIKSAISRANQRAAAKRDYRTLSGQSDHLLRDMGLTRNSIYGVVVRGNDPR